MDLAREKSFRFIENVAKIGSKYISLNWESKKALINYSRMLLKYKQLKKKLETTRKKGGLKVILPVQSELLVREKTFKDTFH
ncbi:hypothetical protein [Candidatus Borrarchaeum sp.]|uniref:hypothetical protein n=1 Tax=Candidatus Borrarchaeum sp. TaxID=2846742 RepID=UPI00257BB90F|nr:hypothetical protein [Candidatus Borrarchaeum sp.]